MKIGEYLKLKRKERELSLRQLSYKTGLSHTYISDIEKGSLVGTNETHEKILQGLNFTEEEKNYFYDLMFENEVLPKHINEKIKKLEIELKECKEKLNIQNNSNNGHIIVGSSNSIKNSYAGTELCNEMRELTEIQREKVLKFINEYIK